MTRRKSRLDRYWITRSSKHGTHLGEYLLVCPLARMLGKPKLLKVKITRLDNDRKRRSRFRLPSRHIFLGARESYRLWRALWFFYMIKLVSYGRKVLPSLGFQVCFGCGLFFPLHSVVPKKSYRARIQSCFFEKNNKSIIPCKSFNVKTLTLSERREDRKMREIEDWWVFFIGQDE